MPDSTSKLALIALGAVLARGKPEAAAALLTGIDAADLGEVGGVLQSLAAGGKAEAYWRQLHVDASSGVLNGIVSRLREVAAEKGRRRLAASMQYAAATGNADVYRQTVRRAAEAVGLELKE